MTGRLERRRIWATSPSQSVTPVSLSTTKSTRSASSVATFTWLRMASSKMSSELTTQPPVSTTENSRSFQVHLPYWRSRVVPAVSLTMARRDCVSRLKSVDLPTLGRPTIATKFDMLLFFLMLINRGGRNSQSIQSSRRVGSYRNSRSKPALFGVVAKLLELALRVAPVLVHLDKGVEIDRLAEELLQRLAGL